VHTAVTLFVCMIVSVMIALVPRLTPRRIAGLTMEVPRLDNFTFRPLF